ncbi:MAG: hypothetical protein IKN38_01335 [Clostridia bacterium]|nr:hypothetical protein [Clostridia bacterium]
MKRIVLILLSLVMSAAFMPLGIFAEGEAMPWEVYENYLYYQNDGTKTSGYTTDGVLDIFTTDENTLEEIDPSFFPEIEDMIDNVKNIDLGRYLISFKRDPEFAQKRPNYSKEDIDEYIGIIKYLEKLDTIQFVEPIKSNIEPFDPVEDWENYDNYLYYKNDGKKGSGYLICEAYVYISSRFIDDNEITPSLFPGIEDRIEQIIPPDQYTTKNLYQIRLTVNDPNGLNGKYDYTEAEIDEYISIVKYINSFDFVIKTEVPLAAVAYPDDPETDLESTDSERSSEEAETEKQDAQALTIDAAEAIPETSEQTAVKNDNETKSPQMGDSKNAEMVVVCIVMTMIALICGSAFVLYKKLNNHN